MSKAERKINAHGAYLEVANQMLGQWKKIGTEVARKEAGIIVTSAWESYQLRLKEIEAEDE